MVGTSLCRGVFLMYRYKATVTSVYDGDTCTVDIDLGFHITLRDIKVRLYGVDTAELRGGTKETKKQAKLARDFVRSTVLNQEIMLVSHGKGKYGRWLCDLYVVDPQTGVETCINNLLIEKGLGKPYLK